MTRYDEMRDCFWRDGIQYLPVTHEMWAVKKPDFRTGHAPPCSKCGKPAPILIGEIAFCEEDAKREL